MNSTGQYVSLATATALYTSGDHKTALQMMKSVIGPPEPVWEP
ncbi:MAG TPA: hypothetical protein VM689_05855 [Aliidongia sp.]|nr:hypothetical protein [Aliidongia sp.]